MKFSVSISKYFAKEKLGSDPVSDFFLHSTSGEKKRVYTRALREAEKEQLRIIDLAKKKTAV